MEGNILVYLIFNLVKTLTIYITLAWHFHISIPKMNIEGKKIQKANTPKSYFHGSQQYHKLWFCQVLVLAIHKFVNCPSSSLNGPNLSWSWRLGDPECSLSMAHAFYPVLLQLEEALLTEVPLQVVQQGDLEPGQGVLHVPMVAQLEG